MKHVCYDTAASPFLFYPAVYETARPAGARQRWYCSDYPLLSPARYYKEAATDLTEEEIKGIRGENAARFSAIVIKP